MCAYVLVVALLLLDAAEFKGEMYADPDRKLYRALGMTIETLKQTPAGEEKRSYLKQSTLTNAVSSIWVSLILSLFTFASASCTLLSLSLLEE